MNRVSRRVMNRRNLLLTAGAAAVGILAVAACGQMAEETTVEPTKPTRSYAGS